MSDELVSRLRETDECDLFHHYVMGQAADRIEALEAENAELKALAQTCREAIAAIEPAHALGTYDPRSPDESHYHYKHELLARIDAVLTR